MNLGVFTLAVCALALLTITTAQLNDCELSDLFNGGTLETEMSTAIPRVDSPSPPTITVLRNHSVCLSVGPTIGKFSSISLVIEYTCTGNDFCPSGQAVEQFDFGCNNQGEWSYVQFSDVDNGRTTNPVANFDTTLRTNCGACFPVHPNQEDPPTIDPVTHCHECRGCSNTTGQMACYGSELGQCCNVYVNDWCADTCPFGGSTYGIDPDTFVCIQLCEDLGTSAAGGTVTYSLSLSEGGYPEGSVATVACNTGYSGGGDITCQSGSWTGRLPECTPVDCGNPPRLDNGKIMDETGTTFGSTVTYECDEDYLFADENVKSRTCEATGSWSDEDIRCEACSIPDCTQCIIQDEKFVCLECKEDFDVSGDNKCERSSQSSSCSCDNSALLVVSVVLAVHSHL